MSNKKEIYKAALLQAIFDLQAAEYEKAKLIGEIACLEHKAKSVYQAIIILGRLVGEDTSDVETTYDSFRKQQKRR